MGIRLQIWQIVGRPLGTSGHQMILLTKRRSFIHFPQLLTAFFYMLRAHAQAIVWMSAMDSHPPQLDPVDFGWEADPSRTFLLPKISKDGVPMAPEFILKLIKCGCKANEPCKTGRCSCHHAALGCTVFCACHGKTCSNPHTPTVIWILTLFFSFRLC